MPILNFEDFPPNTKITAQYADRGVLFPGAAFLDTDPEARSGTRVLRAGRPADEFHSGPFVIEFINPQTTVRLFAGGDDLPVDGVLRAFNSVGTLVDTDGPKAVGPQNFSTLFEVSTATPSIARIELKMGVTHFEAIDDLEFEGGLPPTLPTVSPVVSISFPLDGAELDTSAIIAQGTVTGEDLFGVANLNMQFGLPPSSTAPGLSSSLALVGAGLTRTFTLDTLIALGPHTITVEAENIGGLKGSDTVTFTNLPQAIRARHAAQGGAATFGALQYAGTPCRIAVYEQGAIAAVDSTTFVVLGAIFDKWFSLVDNFSVPGILGCPTSEERGGPGGSRAQDFEKGRIYADLSTGAHYVPDVFVNAIDQLGGEDATGVPSDDPSDSVGIMQTWLFQQFTRPDNPSLLPSTFEIRGTPPMLWVGRQGGDLTFFEDIPLGPRAPTIWQGFACDSNLGPCDIELPESDDSVKNAGATFCDGIAWEEIAVVSGLSAVSGLSVTAAAALAAGAPPAWPAIVGDHVMTPMLGIISGTSMAEWDFPLNHEHHRGPPKYPSDYNIKVRPFHPFRNLFADNTDTVKLEFEARYFNIIFADPELADPFVGDLVFASGRWVVDCGHRPFKSEIHPPGVMIYMRTGLLPDGRPATEARMWVNGFYTGDPVDFDIFPPPRPTPDAILRVEKPVDADAALNVNVEFSTLPPVWTNHVRVRFSGDLVQNEITSLGEMKWKTGRGYYGRWRVYWDDN